MISPRHYGTIVVDFRYEELKILDDTLLGQVGLFEVRHKDPIRREGQ